nr:hypothetical protein CFP56_72061 [Quercus suber]
MTSAVWRVSSRRTGLMAGHWWGNGVESGAATCCADAPGLATLRVFCDQSGSGCNNSVSRRTIQDLDQRSKQSAGAYDMPCGTTQTKQPLPRIEAVKATVDATKDADAAVQRRTKLDAIDHSTPRNSAWQTCSCFSKHLHIEKQHVKILKTVAEW